MHLGKLAVLSSMLLFACSSKKPPAAAQSDAYRTIAATTAMAVVPANTSFAVTMRDALASDTAEPGRRFTAQLAEPILAGDGRVVAPPGSELHGHVVAVQSGAEPRLAISFDSIATRAGHAMFDVRVADVDNAPIEIATMRRPNEADADLVARPSESAIGGGPASADVATRARKVSIPAGTKLELVLTVPLSVALPR